MPSSFSQRPIALAAALALLPLASWSQAPAREPAKEPTRLDTVVVTGIRASLQASIESKRDADTAVEVLTAEDVGKMPDKNIADSLARLPGLNIQYGSALAMDEAERIAIRGSSPNLNLVTVNGHALSSGDWHVGDQGSSGRSVGFGLLPSHLIGRSIVYKTGQANITEGGIAGTVDVQLRRPMDFTSGLTARATAGLVHSDLARKTDPQLSALVAWKSPTGTWAVMAQAFREQRHLRRDGQETFSFPTVAANSAAGLANPNLVGKRLPGSLNSALFEGLRDRVGGAIGVQVRPTQHTELSFTAFKAQLKAENYNSSAYATPAQLINQGANGWLVSDAKIEGDVITAATITRNPRVAANYRVAGMQFDHNKREGAQSESAFIDLDGKWQLNDALTFKGRVGRTEGSGVTQSQPSLGFVVLNPNLRYQINGDRPTDYQLSDPATGKPLDLSNIANWTQVSAGGVAVASKDTESYVHLDGEYALSQGVLSRLRFGLRSAGHTRTYAVWSSRWNAQDRADGFPVTPSPFVFIPGGALMSAVVPPSELPKPATQYPSDYAAGLDADFPRELFRFDPAQLSAYAAKHMNWNRDTNGILTSGYTVKEQNNAVYAMGDFEWGRNWSGNAGVRLVQTRLDSLSYMQLPSGTGTGQCVTLQPCAVPGAIVGSKYGTYLPQRVQTDHLNVLPSLNLRWQVQPGHIARLGLSRTLGRANYNELAGAVSLNNVLLTGSSGNPLLKPITSDNLDLSYGWYFAPRGYVQVSAFHQRIRDYVKSGTSQVEYYNTSTQQNAIYTVTSRTGVSARVSGLEGALELPLGRGFGLGVNGTFVDGKDQDGVALLGTSRLTGNVSLWFESQDFSARLAWNQRSDYAIAFVGNGTQTPGNGLHQYKGSGTLSFSTSYRISDKLSVVLDANNLNNPVRSTYFITENAPGYWHQSGRQFFLSLRARL